MNCLQLSHRFLDRHMKSENSFTFGLQCAKVDYEPATSKENTWVAKISGIDFDREFILLETEKRRRWHWCTLFWAGDKQLFKRGLEINHICGNPTYNDFGWKLHLQLSSTVTHLIQTCSHNSKGLSLFLRAVIEAYHLKNPCSPAAGSRKQLPVTTYWHKIEHTAHTAQSSRNLGKEVSTSI